MTLDELHALGETLRSAAAPPLERIRVTRLASPGTACLMPMLEDPLEVFVAEAVAAAPRELLMHPDDWARIPRQEAGGTRLTAVFGIPVHHDDEGGSA